MYLGNSDGILNSVFWFFFNVVYKGIACTLVLYCRTGKVIRMKRSSEILKWNWPNNVTAYLSIIVVIS